MGADLYTDDEFEVKAYESALRSLSMSASSCGKMRDKLQKRGFSQVIVNSVLAKLQEQGLLDDEEYAKSIVKHELFVYCRSKKLAGLKLKSLKIDEWIIQDALDSVEDTEVFRIHTEFIDCAISRILESLKQRQLDEESRGFELQKEFRKLLGKAARKGISHELVNRRWRELCNLSDWDL
ncbi:MAG: RecX family transcriptional regulator [Candidatus Ancillula sp.]|nr:RecX family transcriptional regulator [Candidatus Ancillula sp.]